MADGSYLLASDTATGAANSYLQDFVVDLGVSDEEPKMYTGVNFPTVSSKLTAIPSGERTSNLVTLGNLSQIGFGSAIIARILNGTYKNWNIGISNSAPTGTSFLQIDGRPIPTKNAAATLSYDFWYEQAFTINPRLADGTNQKVLSQALVDASKTQLGAPLSPSAFALPNDFNDPTTQGPLSLLLAVTIVL